MGKKNGSMLGNMNIVETNTFDKKAFLKHFFPSPLSEETKIDVFEKCLKRIAFNDDTDLINKCHIWL